MRLVGALLVLGFAACGGRAAPIGGPSASNGTATSDDASTVSATPFITFESCQIDFSTKGLEVDGLQCYAEGPPTGAACSPGTACSLCSVPVLCSPTYGPRTFYTCGCSAGGTWSCTVEWQDTTACAPYEAGAPDADATDAVSVMTDGAVCGPGEIVCPVDCCGPSCPVENFCLDAPMCPPPPECPR